MSAQQDLYSAKLSQRYEQLLLEEKYSDCSFVVGNERKRFQCHRVILAAASPVFEAMFYGAMKYSDEDLISDIDIQDIPAPTFQRLITFIYKGIIDINELNLGEIIELYYGAEKYLLNDLIGECLHGLSLKLRFDNIMSTLQLAVCMDLNNLLATCLKFFIRCCVGNEQFTYYFKHKCKQTVSKECLEAVVEHWFEYAETQAQNKGLLWLVCEWNQQQIKQSDAPKEEGEYVYNNLTYFSPLTICQLEKIMASVLEFSEANQPDTKCVAPTKALERAFYRACPPITISHDMFQWSSRISCDNFVALYGFILYSRQSPAVLDKLLKQSSLTVRPPSQYVEENMLIEIKSIRPPCSKNNTHNALTYEWVHHVLNKTVMYNCFINIKWEEAVIMSPGVEYEVTFTWQPSICNGVEYTACLLENDVNGIHFRDCSLYNGSILKGLHIAKLV